MVDGIRQIPNVVGVEKEQPGFAGAQAVRVQFEGGDDTLEEISTFDSKNGGPIMEMKKMSLSLEQVFLELVTEENAHVSRET